ncbi:hypothetical protein HYH37_00510 [Clostridium botulinum]|uniref:hypothetical protein n=2 Tax=Clostridium botulinum TaxID=1491 RepID=UPI001C9B6AA2|nr:hypothetical protein [Clostridium botulinum]MBY6871693.1 hypothetical protein [Clostridium botulinum]
MKIINEIVDNFTDKNYNIKKQCENLTKFILIIEIKKYFIPKFEILKNIISKIPARDMIEITINETNLNCSELSEHDYSIFTKNLNISNIARNINENSILKVEIYKRQQNNNISIYCIETFSNYLNESNLKGILFNLKKYMNGNYLFLRLQNDNFVAYTNSIYFLKENEDISNENSYRKYNIIKKRDMTCSFLNASEYNFYPEDFYFIKRSENKIVNNIFDKLCIVFSLIYICNISNIKNENSVSYTLNGYKLIEDQINFEKIDANIVLNYYYIYKWIYSEENIEDKIGIARNIISLDIKENTLCNISNNVFNSIKSAHSIYLKENVEKYIEIKNKATEFLFDMSQKASELVDRLGKSFINNIIAFVTYFFTIIIMNCLDSNKLNNIFTKDIVIISFVFLVLSCIYMWFSLKEVYEEKQRFKDLYIRLKISYKDVLNKNDIDNIFQNDKYINEDLQFIEKKIKRYKKSWCICLLIIALGVIVG